MYVHRVFAENFRAFGARSDERHLELYLRQGLNVLVGENDAGKTCIVDVIRYVLLTTSNDWLRIEDDDFHIKADFQVDELQLEVELRGLNKAQQAALLDWLTLEEGVEPYLVVSLRAKRRIENSSGSRLSGPVVNVNSGKGGVGPEIGSAARELIRATYLKPLRDAVAELRPKKGSRLSQVLRAHKDVKKEGTNNFDKQKPDDPPSTLVEIMAQAQHRIGNKQVVKDVRDKLNNDYLKTLSFENSMLSSEIRVSAELTLAQILERLELTLRPPGSVSEDMACERGLGYNNVLFMAAELLLLSDGGGDELALLLIEEPEAHLHPQLQTRVLSMLSEKAATNGIQVVVTTHSPNIASTAPVDALTIITEGKAYRLDRDQTCLDDSDYEFLHRFLDATKANLFFARGVMIVEGPAEAIVLPALAEAAGSSFERNSVSIISVGGVGLFRFARILQRKDGTRMPINVACIGDLDIVPDDVTYVDGRRDKIEAGIPKTKDGKEHQKRKARDFTEAEIAELRARKKSRAEGGSTEVFISDYWTLEYDLLRSGIAKYMFVAVRLEQAEGTKGFLAKEKFDASRVEAEAEYARLLKEHTQPAIAADVYQLLHEKNVSKAIVAQYLAKLAKDGFLGSGHELLEKLPPYIRAAFGHLVPERA
jgi:putative ATP-dependent endonuclease of OLD family